MRLLGSLAVIAMVVAATASASAGVIWDNGLEPDGFGLREVSPPGFPDTRVADDFEFRSGTPIQLATWMGVEDADWIRGDLMEMNIYADDQGAPGALVEQRIGPYLAEPTGDRFFGRDAFLYVFEFENVHFDSGTYWIGFRMPNGQGTGTNYWLTSDGGGDGQKSSTGFLSRDSGNTWEPEGDGWHHAFVLVGIPAPGGLSVLGIVGLWGRSRRRA